MLDCPSGFNQIAQGCFRVNTSVGKNWTDAEAQCQTYGNHVHLARLDTQQVGLLLTLIFHNNILHIQYHEHSENNYISKFSLRKPKLVCMMYLSLILCEFSAQIL